jgi:hypothetical protein
VERRWEYVGRPVERDDRMASFDGFMSFRFSRKEMICCGTSPVTGGSGNKKWDVVISRFRNVAAGHRLEFRAELFKALNKPQFDDPVVTPGNNPLAGKIMSTSDFGFTQTERVIQMDLKYSF